jgi:tetratricopeptide (TPR) repeat protein
MLEDPAAKRAAWGEYLQGRAELRRRGSGHLREAISHFALALRSDAMLPQAYAGLADAWSLLPLYDPAAGQQPLARALDAVDHALALDPKLPEARASRGHLLAGMWRWSDAEADLRAALAANSALVDARQWLGELLLLTGRHAEAVNALTSARALDPTSPVLVSILGLALAIDNQIDAATGAINMALQLDPSFTEAYLFGGAAQLIAGRPKPATELLHRGVALAPTDPLMIGLLGQAYAQSGDSGHARAMLRELDGLPAGIPRNGARAHIELGLRDSTAAFAALDQAVTDHEPIFAAEPMGTPLFSEVRRTPHFAVLLSRLGFPAGTAATIRSSPPTR